ncbi:MAG: ribbon-helix-helix domain-containing protein [Patescibacteria group bacterium]|nr:ribbon-helix-helix domain-containing protein [Patescibacteria group bacterium]
MNTYNISLNKELAVLVDRQIKLGKFANRSEFFRQLLRHAFFSKTQSQEDWIYSEPFFSELRNRVSNIHNGKEKIISGKNFDKEFNL